MIKSATASGKAAPQTARRVVITGIGIVSPLGISFSTFWQHLLNNSPGIGRVTRFTPDRFSCQLAGEVSDEDCHTVDESLTHEARRMDRFIRYAIFAAADALRDSGIKTEKQASCGGVFMGVAMGGLPHLEAGVIRQETKGPRKTSPFLIPSLIPSMATSMVAADNQLTCSQYTIAGACASGSQAIGQAFQAVRDGRIPWALAGGTEAVITPITFSGFEAMRVLSRHPAPEQTPRPFDRERDGMIVGEGSALFVLEEQTRAAARGAHIYGEVSGYATCSGGSHIALQSVQETMRCIRLCLEDANLTSADIDGIYAQASGLTKGDAVELEAICRLFEHQDRPVITSIKGHIGHSFAASGPLNVAAALMALQEQQITPTQHLASVESQYAGLNIIAKARRVPLRSCLINAFGFGGVNGCLIVSKNGNTR